jgi:hypothetical protein
MKIFPYAPSSVSLASSLIQKNKNNYHQGIENEIIVAVLQDIVNLDVAQIFKATAMINPNFKQLTDAVFKIKDLCIVSTCVQAIKDAMSLRDGLEVTADFETQVEDIYSTNTFNVKKDSNKDSNDNSKVKSKSESEMEDLAEDGCGGACKL